jgi:uncharacterized membrane protein YhaH (DUF805 family)
MAKTGVSHDTAAHVHFGAIEDHAAHAGHRAGTSHFWWHLVQMIIAMLAGMAVLGVPFRAILGSLGYTFEQAVARFPEIVCLVMTFNMAVGMVAWMRFRGHGWRASAEMTGAMYAATAVTLGMFWLHIISVDPLIGLMHILMLPAMLLAMLYRRDEYAYAHH